MLNSIQSEIFEKFLSQYFFTKVKRDNNFSFWRTVSFHIFHRHTENWQAVTMLFNLTMFLIYHQFPAKPIVHIHDHWFSKNGSMGTGIPWHSIIIAVWKHFGAFLRNCEILRFKMTYIIYTQWLTLKLILKKSSRNMLAIDKI